MRQSYFQMDHLLLATDICPTNERLKSLSSKVDATLARLGVHERGGERGLDYLKAEGLQERHVLLKGERRSQRGGHVTQPGPRDPVGPLGFVNSVLVLVEVGLGAESLSADFAAEPLLGLRLGFGAVRRRQQPRGSAVAV